MQSEARAQQADIDAFAAFAGPQGHGHAAIERGRVGIEGGDQRLLAQLRIGGRIGDGVDEAEPLLGDDEVGAARGTTRCN